MQARRIARELALLSSAQLPAPPKVMDAEALQSILVAAVQALAGEARDALQTASAELQQSNDRLLKSETRAADVESARSQVAEAVALTEQAINRVGVAMDFPTILATSNQKEVKDYTIQLLSQIKANQVDIDQLLEKSLVDWQLSRLAWIDLAILRIATAEIQYLGIPEKVAINEAVDLAKRYSTEDGHRFINGVLRRVIDQIPKAGKP
jgi:transcription antitermination protein NusB